MNSKQIQRERETQALRDPSDAGSWKSQVGARHLDAGRVFYSPAAQAGDPIWNIGYGLREYASMMGDPVLCQIVAPSKEDAEAAAEMGGWGQTAGVWAWR